MELAHPHLHLYPQVKPYAEKHSGPKIKRKFLIFGGAGGQDSLFKRKAEKV